MCRGPPGLFGQNDSEEGMRCLHWPEADQLKRLAREIQSIREEFGSSNPLCEKFLEYRAMRGTNVKGEPKFARQFLEEIRAT
jgi:hypothetical protein